MGERQIPSFSEYLGSLSRMSEHIDPTLDTALTLELRDAARDLTALVTVDAPVLATWIRVYPDRVPVLGLAVGLTQEKLKNNLTSRFGTASWKALARDRSQELIAYLDEEFDLVDLLNRQRHRSYGFADVIVARAGTRALAVRAGSAGRRLEDEIEAVARDLGLEAQTRTRFEGRNGRTAPCDLVVPSAQDALIVVAAKAFDSTGSKLSDAVREIEEMADVRQPRQHVMAVVDGIGWKSRQSDLRRIFGLWESHQIDGLYTLRSLAKFRIDLEEAARIHKLIV